MFDIHHSADDHLVIPPFGDPNQALFNGTGNLSPEVADSSQILSRPNDTPQITQIRSTPHIVRLAAQRATVRTTAARIEVTVAELERRRGGMAGSVAAA